MPFPFHARNKRKKKNPKPTWDTSLSSTPPRTPQELAIIVINNNPQAFYSIKALVEAMTIVNDSYNLGFLVIGIKEAARITVRSDDPELSAVYGEIEYHDDLDQDIVASAWRAIGQRFDDPEHAVSTIKTWMSDTKRRIAHDATEAHQMPLIVGDAVSCDRFVKPLIAPLRGFYGHFDAASLTPRSITDDDGLSTIPVAVVAIGAEGARVDELACLASQASIALTNTRNMVRIRNSTSFIGTSPFAVPCFENLFLEGCFSTQLRVDHQILWQSVQ